MTDSGTGPAITGVHHFSPTVSDVEASARWYERVFGMTRSPSTFPHHAAEAAGYSVILTDPRSGLVIGLHHHDSNSGEPFAENRTGLDHISFAVAQRSELDDWASWLDKQGVPHSGVISAQSPAPYAVVVFRDPDNIQLELFHIDS